jgi:hypothetical protein
MAVGELIESAWWWRRVVMVLHSFNSLNKGCQLEHGAQTVLQRNAQGRGAAAHLQSVFVSDGRHSDVSSLFNDADAVQLCPQSVRVCVCVCVCVCE